MPLHDFAKGQDLQVLKLEDKPNFLKKVRKILLVNSLFAGVTAIGWHNSIYFHGILLGYAREKEQVFFSLQDN